MDIVLARIVLNCKTRIVETMAFGLGKKKKDIARKIILLPGYCDFFFIRMHKNVLHLKENQ